MIKRNYDLAIVPGKTLAWYYCVKREVRALREAANEFKQTQNTITTLDEEWTSEDGAIQVLPL